MSGFKHQISQRQLAFLPVGRHTVNHISTDNRFNYWAAPPQPYILLINVRKQVRMKQGHMKRGSGALLHDDFCIRMSCVNIVVVSQRPFREEI